MASAAARVKPRDAFRGFPDSTRRVYDLLAGIYPMSTLLFHDKAHKAALALAGIRDGMRVLEAATGSGEMFRRIVRLNPGGLTCGFDLSFNMAARTERLARRRFPRAQSHCQAVDASRMPFCDGSFDAVVCCYLFELMTTESTHQALAEIHRVLRPGGRLALVMIGQNVPAFNVMYRIGGSLAPAFWGRQVERAVPEAIRSFGFAVEHDRAVRQGYYPSRVLVARR
jgi:ubiquinone/menaquinone biosynthesis C-methylase UbiE